MNDTSSSEARCNPQEYTSNIIYIAIVQLSLAAVAIFGNSLVIYSVIRCPNLRTVTNYFVVSLAAADLLVGLNVPFYDLFYVYVELACNRHLCLLRYWFCLFASSCSMLSMIGVAIDRYLAIVKALSYTRIVKHRPAIAYITSVWIFSFLLSLPPFLDMGCSRVSPIMICDLTYIYSKTYMIVIVATFVLTSALVTTVLYLVIFRVAWTKLKSMPTQKAAIRSEIRIASTMALVLTVCFVGYLPYFVIVLLPLFSQRDEMLTLYVKPYVICLYFGKSALNPFIYGLKAKDFRRAFKKILLRKKSLNSLNSVRLGNTKSSLKSLGSGKTNA